MSSFVQRPNRSAWPAIVPKTARFARCHCSFYRFAFHKFPLCLILLWIHARGSSAKRSRGRCKTQLFNRSSRRKKCRGARWSALANLGLMEPARFFRSLRHARIDQDGHDRWHRTPSRHATTLTSRCWIFFRFTEKHYFPRSISLNASFLTQVARLIYPGIKST